MSNHRKVSLRRVPTARRLRVSAAPVTRAEYNHIVVVLNERREILTAIQDAIARLEQASDVQFKRTAQIQADLDEIKKAWDRMRVAT